MTTLYSDENILRAQLWAAWKWACVVAAALTAISAPFRDLPLWTLAIPVVAGTALAIAILRVTSDVRSKPSPVPDGALTAPAETPVATHSEAPGVAEVPKPVAGIKPLELPITSLEGGHLVYVDDDVLSSGRRILEDFRTWTLQIPSPPAIVIPMSCKGRTTLAASDMVFLDIAHPTLSLTPSDMLSLDIAHPTVSDAQFELSGLLEWLETPRHERDLKAPLPQREAADRNILSIIEEHVSVTVHSDDERAKIRSAIRGLLADPRFAANWRRAVVWRRPGSEAAEPAQPEFLFGDPDRGNPGR